MNLPGWFQDGLTARMHRVRVRTVGSLPEIVAMDTESGEILTRWQAGSVYPVYARRDEMRVGSVNDLVAARIIFRGKDVVAAAQAALPALVEHRMRERSGQQRIAMLATLVLALVIGAYLYGIPFVADRLVAIVPPEWETDLGDTAERQMAAMLSQTGVFEACDPDPASIANRAIAGFAARVIDGIDTPFDLDVTVIRTDVPNAFALPGGKVFFFSGLLDRAETPDEFAGVLAHEIGHVVYRHGIEKVIATAGTGALIGFVLGDLTGISIAAGIGSTLIDTRFSREAEREADRFAANAASRLGFAASGMPDLLDRAAEDTRFDRALAFFSTHPLTEDRRAALERMTSYEDSDPRPAFSADEWRAIRMMCGSSS
jgi:predicted Zn-dependent protease